MPRSVGGARRKTVPPSGKSRTKAASGATGRARSAGTRTRPSRGRGFAHHVRRRVSVLASLAPADWLKIAGFLMAIATGLVGYGKNTARLEAIAKEQEREIKMIDAIYQRSLWEQGGKSGPEIPVPGE